MTTIVVSADRDKIEQQEATKSQPDPHVEIPINKSSEAYLRYPQVVDDSTTTTKIQEIYEVHEIKREEITRYSPTNQGTTQVRFLVTYFF